MSASLKPDAIEPDGIESHTPLMPPDVQRAFECYMLDGQRSLRKVGEKLGIPDGTIRSWNTRYSWARVIERREREEDVENLRGALHKLALMRWKAVETIEAILDDETAPHKVRLDAATRIMDRTGLTPAYVKRLLEAPEAEAELEATAIADAVSAASAGDSTALSDLIARTRRTIPR